MAVYIPNLIYPERSDAVIKDPDHVYSTGYGDTLYYIEMFNQGIFFYSNPLNVLNAEYHLNRNFVLRGEQTTEELFKFFGIPESAYESVYPHGKDEVGWESYTMSATFDQAWIDFMHRSALTKSGKPLVMISFVVRPYKLYEDNPEEWLEEMDRARERWEYDG